MQKKKEFEQRYIHTYIHTTYQKISWNDFATKWHIREKSILKSFWFQKKNLNWNKKKRNLNRGRKKSKHFIMKKSSILWNFQNFPDTQKNFHCNKSEFPNFFLYFYSNVLVPICFKVISRIFFNFSFVFFVAKWFHEIFLLCSIFHMLKWFHEIFICLCSNFFLLH